MMTFKAVYAFWVFIAVIFFVLLWLFKPVLTPFVIGIAIAYLLNPLMNRLVQLRLSRRLAALLILFVFFSLLTIVMIITIPMMIREATQLAQALPGICTMVETAVQPYIERVHQIFGSVVPIDWMGYAEKYLSQALSFGAGFAANIASNSLAAIGAIMTALLIPIASYFLMKDWPRIVGWVKDLIPPSSRNTVEGLLLKMDSKISGFIRGQIALCALLGFVYAIVLTLAGLNSGFLIGIMTGILSIIPYVGSTIGLVLSLGIAWFQSSDMTYVATIAAIFFVGQFIEGNFVAPKLVGDSVGLHPLWVIFALLSGGTLYGIVGMFLAIPIAAILSVLIGFAIERYRESSFYKKEQGQG